MMSPSKTLKIPDGKSILFEELNSHLMDISASDDWSQALVNLLNQYLNSDFVEFFSPLENKIFISEKEPKINKNIDFISEDEISWNDKTLVVPFKGNGFLKITFQAQNEINADEKYLFNLIGLSLRNRNNLMLSASDKYISSLENIKKILSANNSLKKSIPLIAKEITDALGCSRAQIKVFSSSASSVYDNNLCAESKAPGVFDAISIVPAFEDDYIVNNFNVEKEYVFDTTLNSEIEKLLSVKSAYIQPLEYGSVVGGLLILHQTNYKRIFKSQEKKYLSQIGFLLGFILGKNKESVVEKDDFSSDELMTSDNFLRYLGHLHMKLGVDKNPFSLILIDIKKLSDINNRLGFVAGNLVISQTLRYLFRFYDGRYKLARYGNDEFVVVLEGIDNKKILEESSALKNYLSNISVLGVGPVEYNFSHASFPTHTESTAELLILLEKAMKLAKSRGKSDICSASELLDKSNENFSDLISQNMPEILLSRSSLKTGPEMISAIDEQLKTKKIDYAPDVLDSVKSLALALDAKDSYTEGHSQRVGEYSYLLAKQIGLSLQEQEWVRLAGIMHDVGKIGIPENILCKNGKLTPEEFEIMKKHPVISARILKPIKQLEPVASLVLSHHEYWDGSGYPHGLTKDEIPVGAMIVSIADAYQAMTSDRPYRAGMAKEIAFERLRGGKERQWNPELIEEFIKVIG